jgi:hypothetical protein
LVRDLVEMTISNELHPLVRKRLTEVVQLFYTYARLAELELAAREKPRAGNATLPEDTSERIWTWAEGEEEHIREREQLVGERSAAMRARGRDTQAVIALLGG